MTDRTDTVVWKSVQVVVVALVLALFLFEVQSILNPVLVFVLLWAVLRPFTDSAGHGALLTVTGLVTGLWVLSETGTILAPFILSLVLAYVLDPLVDRLTARGLSRSLAVISLIVPAVGLLALLVLIAVPAALRQVEEVLLAVPTFFDRLGGWIEAGQARLIALEVPLLNGEAVVEQFRAIDSAAVVDFLRERQEALTSWLWSGVLGLGRGIGSVFTILGYLVLTPVLTFYLIRDWDLITARIGSLFPQDRSATWREFFGACDRLISSYLRGQITVAISMGIITGVGLAIVGFPYAATLGLVVGIFSVVPYLGLVISLIPAIFIALVSGSVLTSLLKVVAVYGVAQLLDGTLITPRIVGESVGIHPVWVVLALSLGGFLFGFVGLLIAVPVAAVVKLLILRGLERYEGSDFFRGRQAVPGE